MNRIERWCAVMGATGMVLAAGCNEHPLKTVELKREQVGEGTVALTVNKDVDILFVIDNSRSMVEEQATLAANFEAFIARLEEPGIEANYRIAVTTTDNGFLGGWCPNRDAGNFQLSSCRSRSEDFVDAFGTDAFDEGCLDVCRHDEISTLPTTTHVDPTPRSRPWLERLGGRTNLADDVTTAEAFACLGPQGVTGCGFEAPLESMRLALAQAGDANSTEYGFLRDGAIFAVVIVTDEADCSARWGEVPEPWDPAGDRALWSELNADSPSPTSEVCWFAGVECEDAGDGTKACRPVDRAADGSVTDDPDEAVLHQLSRYSEVLTQMQAQGKEVLVAVIAGVPTGYEGDPLAYSDSLDLEFQREMGIGPGCVSANGEAVPPVRLLELAEEFRLDEPNVYSICKASYVDALEDIAGLIEDRVEPGCVDVCVADERLDLEGLQHGCTLRERHTDVYGRAIERSVPECVTTEAGFEVPEGSDVCFRSLSDSARRTETSQDDMADKCVARGVNLQFQIERREDAFAPGDATYEAQCRVSDFSARDCPGLDG